MDGRVVAMSLVPVKLATWVVGVVTMSLVPVKLSTRVGGVVTMSLVPVKLSAQGGGYGSANAGFADTWWSHKTENGSFELGGLDLSYSQVFQHPLLQFLQAIVVIVQVFSETQTLKVIHKIFLSNTNFKQSFIQQAIGPHEDLLTIVKRSN